MRARVCGLLLLLAVGLAQVAAGAGRMAYPCYRAPVGPVMDGLIAGDPAWSRIPTATGFSKLGDGYTDAKQTYAQACWDDRALYVGVTCEEPDIALVKPQVRDGGDTWLDDGVEIFLQPEAGGQVYQFVVTAGGARGGFEGAPDFLKYQASAHAGDGLYSLEVRIPFELVRAAPKLGDEWRGDFCRNIFTTASGGDKFTCWAPLVSRFLEPEHFATIQLLGPAPDEAQAGAISDRLSRPYRAHLSGKLRTVAAEGAEYVPALKEAAADARFRVQAERLLDRWGELAEVQRRVASAPLPEVRRILKDASGLAQESYEAKYHYLIAKVLGD
jgi:Carbohydrate family 9 binding domain-like